MNVSVGTALKNIAGGAPPYVEDVTPIMKFPDPIHWSMVLAAEYWTGDGVVGVGAMLTIVVAGYAGSVTVFPMPESPSAVPSRTEPGFERVTVVLPVTLALAGDRAAGDVCDAVPLKPPVSFSTTRTESSFPRDGLNSGTTRVELKSAPMVVDEPGPTIVE